MISQEFCESVPIARARACTRTQPTRPDLRRSPPPSHLCTSASAKRTVGTRFTRHKAVARLCSRRGTTSIAIARAARSLSQRGALVAASTRGWRKARCVTLVRVELRRRAGVEGARSSRGQSCRADGGQKHMYMYVITLLVAAKIGDVVVRRPQPPSPLQLYSSVGEHPATKLPSVTTESLRGAGHGRALR